MTETVGNKKTGNMEPTTLELISNASVAAFSAALVSIAVGIFIEKAFLAGTPFAMKAGAYAMSFVVFFALILIDEALKRDICFVSAAAVASLCAVLREISTALAASTDTTAAVDIMLQEQFYFTCVLRFAVFYICLLAARALSKGIWAAARKIQGKTAEA